MRYTFSCIVVVSKEAVVDVAGVYFLVHWERRWLHWETQREKRAIYPCSALMHAFSPDPGAQHTDAPSYYTAVALKSVNKRTVRWVRKPVSVRKVSRGGAVCSKPWFNVKLRKRHPKWQQSASKSMLWNRLSCTVWQVWDVTGGALSLKCWRDAAVDAAHRLKCETGAATVTPPPLSTCVSFTPACAQTMMLCVTVFQHLLNYSHLHHLYNDDYNDDDDDDDDDEAAVQRLDQNGTWVADRRRDHFTNSFLSFFLLHIQTFWTVKL